jgi:DNA-binding transcriptional regulator of glucitol operon
MTAESPVLNTRLTRALCIVVFLVMAIAVLYGAWIGISNYSRIHV